MFFPLLVFPAVDFLAFVRERLGLALQQRAPLGEQIQFRRGGRAIARRPAGGHDGDPEAVYAGFRGFLADEGEGRGDGGVPGDADGGQGDGVHAEVPRAGDGGIERVPGRDDGEAAGDAAGGARRAQRAAEGGFHAGFHKRPRIGQPPAEHAAFRALLGDREMPAPRARDAFDGEAQPAFLQRPIEAGGAAFF